MPSTNQTDKTRAKSLELICAGKILFKKGDYSAAAQLFELAAQRLFKFEKSRLLIETLYWWACSCQRGGDSETAADLFMTFARLRMEMHPRSAKIQTECYPFRPVEQSGGIYGGEANFS